MYKIYKIVDNTNGNVYVGQTKNTLKYRISRHIYDYNNKPKYLCSSVLILSNNDWCYELIEETQDITREIFWIQNTPNCINKTKYNFSYEEWLVKYKKESNKKWRDKNELHIKKYRDENKEKHNYNQKQKRKYINSWGGDPRYNNNLLKIDVNLFNTS